MSTPTQLFTEVPKKTNHTSSGDVEDGYVTAVAVPAADPNSDAAKELARLKAENEALKQSQLQSSTNAPNNGTPSSSAPDTVAPTPPVTAGSNNSNNNNDKKPWYCQWYVILAVVVVVAIIVGVAAGVVPTQSDPVKNTGTASPSSPSGVELNGEFQVDLSDLPLATTVEIALDTAQQPLVETYFEQGGEPQVLPVPSDLLTINIKEGSAVVTLGGVNCTSGSCAATSNFTRTLEVDLMSLPESVDVDLYVQDGGSWPLRSLEDVGGSILNLTVLATESFLYTLDVTDGNGVKTIEDIDCSPAGSCLVPSLDAILMVDLVGLPEWTRLDVFTSDRQYVRTDYEAGGDVKTYNVLNLDEYLIEIKLSGIVLDTPNVDCSSGSCNLTELTSSLLINATSVFADTLLRVRQEDFNSQLLSRDNIGGEVLNLTVFRMPTPYTLRFQKSGALKEVDDVDCSSGSCSVEADTIGAYLLANLTQLPEETLRADLGIINDDGKNYISGTPGGNQGGALQSYPVLALDGYFVRLSIASHTVEFFDVDCETGDCTAPPMSSILRVVDLDPAVVTSFDINAPAEQAGAVGPRVLRFIDDYTVDSFEFGVICGDGYAMYFWGTTFDGTRLLTGINCPCGGVCTASFTDAA